MPEADFKVSDQPAGGNLLSVPDTVLYHAVEDGELQRLMQLEKPIPAAISLTSLGAALGLSSPSYSAIVAVLSDEAVQASDNIYLLVLVGSLVLAISTGIVAFRGKSDAERALEDIRARPKIPLPIGHPAAPPIKPD